MNACKMRPQVSQCRCEAFDAKDCDWVSGTAGRVPAPIVRACGILSSHMNRYIWLSASCYQRSCSTGVAQQHAH